MTKLHKTGRACADFEVTPNMIEAGVAAFRLWEMDAVDSYEYGVGVLDDSAASLVASVFALMAGQAPSLKELGRFEHASDCAVYNPPALEAGDCDCGAAKVRRRSIGRTPSVGEA
jgi:hypothetical protein